MAKTNRQEIRRQRGEGRKYNGSHFIHGNPSPERSQDFPTAKDNVQGLKIHPYFLWESAQH